MPITCVPGPHHDWLQYVLYSSDVNMIQQIIMSAYKNIEKRFARYPQVATALRPFAPNPMTDSLNTLQIKMLLLMDLDEGVRVHLCNYKTDLVRDRRPLCPRKATRFYTELHYTLIPAWLQDADVTHDKFIDDVRGAYLVS